MNKFILIEGVDNVGKSTLIKNLKNEMNQIVFQNFHFSSVKQDSTKAHQEYGHELYTQMFYMMFTQTRFKNSGFICDRSHIGEMVYGPIYRGYSGDYVLEIEKQFKEINYVWDNLYLITLIDNPENVINRDDGQSFTIEESVKQMEINEFVEATNKSLIKNKLILNIKDLNEQMVLQKSLEFLTK